MIHLLITGGTLDKDYDPITGRLVFPGSCVDGLLKQANVTVPVEATVLMQKDSLDMDATDRQRIRDACQTSPHRRIVITHGTDTMTNTARHLAEAGLDKTIVLTGAMRPHRLGRSDALFNLGTAIMAAQLAPKGVWIAMNGMLLPADKAQKNRQLGRFERI